MKRKRITYRIARRIAQRQRALSTPTLRQRIQRSAWFLGLEVCAITAGIAALVFTVYQTQITVREIQASAQARNEEASARAWSLLATRASGNSGKIGALEYLAAQGVPLSGIDLSCQTMSGLTESEYCLRRTLLRNLDFSEPTIQDHETQLSCDAVLSTPSGWIHLPGTERSYRYQIDWSNFTYADLSNSLLMDGYAFEASFHGSIIESADLSGSCMTLADFSASSAEAAIFEATELSGASFAAADLTSANFDGANVSNTDFSATNLSATDFTDAIDTETALFDGSFSVFGQEPIGLDPLYGPQWHCIGVSLVRGLDWTSEGLSRRFTDRYCSENEQYRSLYSRDWQERLHGTQQQ